VWSRTSLAAVPLLGILLYSRGPDFTPLCRVSRRSAVAVFILLLHFFCHWHFIACLMDCIIADLRVRVWMIYLALCSLPLMYLASSLASSLACSFPSICSYPGYQTGPRSEDSSGFWWHNQRSQGTVQLLTVKITCVGYRLLLPQLGCQCICSMCVTSCT